MRIMSGVFADLSRGSISDVSSVTSVWHESKCSHFHQRIGDGWNFCLDRLRRLANFHFDCRYYGGGRLFQSFDKLFGGRSQLLHFPLKLCICFLLSLHHFERRFIDLLDLWLMGRPGRHPCDEGGGQAGRGGDHHSSGVVLCTRNAGPN